MYVDEKNIESINNVCRKVINNFSVKFNIYFFWSIIEKKFILILFTFKNYCV